MTISAFNEVHNDDRVGEIIIVDDASEITMYEELKKLCSFFPKVKLYRNLFNRDCYLNKHTAVSFCNYDWVGLWDSDNLFDTDYLDKIYNYEWDESTIYTPSFAKPSFDFRYYSGLTISAENVKEYIEKPLFETMLNAANYFVPKNKWLSVWDNSTDPVTSDSIFQCYNWLKNGGKIFVVPGLEYIHTIHNGSHYQTNVQRTQKGFHEDILKKLKELK